MRVFTVASASALLLALTTTTTPVWSFPVATPRARSPFLLSRAEEVRSRHQQSSRSRLHATSFQKQQQGQEDSDPDQEDSSLLEKEYDYIIIGSGIGGLTVASLLAQCTSGPKRQGSLLGGLFKKKKRRRDNILVLEQHDVVGGGLHTFERHGYSFGVGLHYVGEMGEQNSTNMNTDTDSMPLLKMLQALTPKHNPVEWDKLPDNFDTILLGGEQQPQQQQDPEDPSSSSTSLPLRRYDIVAHRHQQVLQQAFPEDRTAIDVYFELIEKAARAGQNAMQLKLLPQRLVQFLLNRKWLLQKFDRGYSCVYATSTVKDVVESLTDNPDLQAVLQYSWADYGTSPSKAPFVMHALLTQHYSNGAYYPTGGPSVLPQTIGAVLSQRNCRIETSCAVKQVLVEEPPAAENEQTQPQKQKQKKARVVGVQLADGREIRARKAVISNAGYRNTVSYLLPPEYRPNGGRKDSNNFKQDEDNDSFEELLLQNKNRGPSAISLFVGLRGDHDLDWQLPSQQLWMYPETNIKMDRLANRCYDDDMNSPTSNYNIRDLRAHDFAPVFVGSPSGKDSRYKFRHPGRCVLEILAPAPWAWFETYAPPSNTQQGNDDDDVQTTPVVFADTDPGGSPGSHGAEYNQVKQELAQLLWTRARQGLVECGASTKLPHLVQELDFYELGTPLTYAHYLRGERGTLYGLQHDVQRFEPRQFALTLRPDSTAWSKDLDGLYLTGQDVASCGIAGAMVGGYLCASKLLGVRNPYKLLKRVQRRRVLYADENSQNMKRGLFGWLFRRK